MPTTTHENALLPQGGRVLVVRLSALGDVLFALETVAALAAARPDVAIDFLVADSFSGLLAGHPQLRRVIPWPRKQLGRLPAAVRELRREAYDLVLDLHGILKSSIPLLLTRARLKVGFAPPGSREGSHRFHHRSIPLPQPLPHRADRGLLLLQALGIPVADTQPRLGAVEPLPGPLDALPTPRVLLHPGTSAFAAFKRWPAERHAELARRLLARGIGVAVSHGPGERELVQSVLQAAPGALELDGTKLGLRGLAGALRRFDAVVAADTGPLHLATAMGTSAVALFGPKDTAKYGPRSHGTARNVVLHADVPCRPCTRRDCATPLCVLGIPVDAVEQAVLLLLEART